MFFLGRISRAARLLALVSVLALSAISSVGAADHLAVAGDGVAIRGYDPVAYFTFGKAMPGNPSFEHSWDGARWWFANAEHLELFSADPERYAPRFGGYCTGGLSLGYKIVADPENWYIADGDLHLHHTPEGRERALANLDSVLPKAAETWARLTGN